MKKGFWIYAGSMLALAVMLSVSLVACDPKTMLQKLIPAEQAKVGQAYLENVRLRQQGALLRDADPEIRDALRSSFKLFANQFPSEKPKSIKVVGSQVSTASGVTQYALMYEYEFSGRWLLADIVLSQTGGKRLITGLHFQPMARSLEQIHAFTFSGKSMRHGLFLLCAVLLPFFILGTAIASIRILKVRRKWLLVIPITIGIATFTLNWTTGEIAFSPFAFALLGSGWFKGLYGPVQLQISVPLGAIAFWLWYFFVGRKRKADLLPE